MKDREIFRQAIKELPSLLFPLLVAFGIVRFIEYAVSSLIVYTPIFLMMQKNGKAVAVGSMLFLNVLVEVISCLMSLGCFRLCLARGCGERGTMPWTIFGQWSRYKGWILWMGLFPTFWQTGKSFFRIWLVYHLNDAAYHDYSVWNANIGMGLVIGSWLLFMLLSISVRTAYLRTPEKGFWYSLIYGLKEGLRKWPKTIGAQLKFVVPIILVMRVMNFIFDRLVVGTGSLGMISFCRGVMNSLESTWILTFYGFLAAARYDPPEGEICPVEDGELQQGE